MGDANVRRPVLTRFEHGVDFGLLVHNFPFMADKRDPLVLSNYIFELLEVNPGVAGFLIQLRPEDVDAMLESVTAHAEKGAGTKTTLYVGQEEEEEVQEEAEEVEEVGTGKGKPHNPLMISAQKVRMRPGKGKGKSDGWFPQPLTHNTRWVCTDDPKTKLPMHFLCPTREWERERYGVTTPNIISGQGVILFPFGATPPLIGEVEEVVAAEPLGAFKRDANDLVLTVGGKLVVNHLLEHDFLSDVQLQSLLDDLDRVPLSDKASIFNEDPPVRTPWGPLLWVVVHFMVKCIQGLYELWRVREMYTLTQVERHRALTTKFSRAWGDSGWSPTRWIHWCLAHSTFFAEKWRTIFQFYSIPTEYRHGPYKRRLKNCFKGWSLVRASMSLRHMHHCMSMNALEQGLLALEAARASDIDDCV